MDDAAKKSRTIERKLRDVQTLPAPEGDNLLLISQTEQDDSEAADGTT
jgi:hypothetical protein